MHRTRTAMTVLLLSAGFMLLCRFAPPVANAWTLLVILPASGLLANLSAHLRFPILEPAAILLTGWTLAPLLKAAAKRSLRTSFQFFRRCAGAALTLLVGYALLWYPAYWRAPTEQYSAAPEQIQSLCEALIERLNESSLTFSPAGKALENAERAASLFLDRPVPTGAVKTARYPEWMTALGIAGLYSPWTGEAIVSPLAAPAALTFTACHELMHLAGIADEGQANIAAWSACHRLGGETADSADLWALRYALAVLMEADADAWRDCIRRMGTPLREIFGGMNGFSPPSRRASPAMDAVLAIAGLTETAASYDALAAWLAIDILTVG